MTYLNLAVLNLFATKNATLTTNWLCKGGLMLPLTGWKKMKIMIVMHAQKTLTNTTRDVDTKSDLPTP